jgi:2-polyprenyl-3-methyl-5-hydroxy-6-metoxy-1,4-benzoquinol methylase
MLNGLKTLLHYWFPPYVDQSVVGPELERFYRDRSDYHDMTDYDEKVDDPQVRLFLTMLSPGDKVVEFGCGGGSALAAAGARVAEARGYDIGETAIASANSRPGNHIAIHSDVAHVPLPDNYADVVYSFEVLEHVWDPASVIREMIRVVKPGGLVFFSMPNGYDMNMHLKQRPAVRLVNHVCALIADVNMLFRSQPYENVPPELDADPIYPDCDRISRAHPRNLGRFVEACGCRVERLETHFFRIERAESEEERLKFQTWQRHFFYRWHGDHILLVARKSG